MWTPSRVPAVNPPGRVTGKFEGLTIDWVFVGVASLRCVVMSVP